MSSRNEKYIADHRKNAETFKRRDKTEQVTFDMKVETKSQRLICVIFLEKNIFGKIKM